MISRKHVAAGLAVAAMTAGAASLPVFAAKAPAPAPAGGGGGGGGGKVPPAPVGGGGGGGGVKVLPPVAGGGGGGGKVPPAPVAGGGGGGGGVVLPPPPAPVAGGGGAGSLNAVMTTAPGFAVNMDPTQVGALTASIPTIRFIPARSTYSVTLADMDSKRFPIASCTVSGTINGAPVVGTMVASVAPAVGNTASTKATMASGAGVPSTLDVVCKFTDPKLGPQDNEAHFQGTL